MDVAALVAFLAPCMPYLLRTGEQAANEASRVLGDEVFNHAKRLWQRLRGSVEAKPAAAEAAADAAEHPEDDRRRIALELQLEKLLAEDGKLAQDVERLFDEARGATTIASGERNVVAGRDIHGSVIVPGDSNRIITGDSSRIGPEP